MSPLISGETAFWAEQWSLRENVQEASMAGSSESREQAAGEEDKEQWVLDPIGMVVKWEVVEGF